MTITRPPELPMDAFSVFAAGLDHPECCAFDGAGNLWAGGEAGQIYRVDAKGNTEEVLRAGGFTGGIAFSPGGTLFVCNPKHGVLRVEPSGRWEVFATEGGGGKLIEPNYPLFDTQGRLYISDSGGWEAGLGRVIRFDPSGSSIEIASGLGYANGLALTPDERTLYVAESDTNCILRIALDDSGSPLGAPEQYTRAAGQVPDGLGLDVEGHLYVTCYGSHEILRISPAGQVAVFARDPTGIVMGGPTNLTFEGPDVYVANLARTTILRARVPTPGLPPVNRRSLG